ncbi:hypothetical protein BDP81DRAFT_393933 [Colletotrichum phormii]|uniref:Uncharacterized protein n=1 Tax=Colletotrichum phormii TaxID=359342 RepID=A0AAJ0EHT2_9PEZI|nr:uncharacterized protein BDP81DRAFT_393933 [Colletotrichum phormii]KAK1637255.1 hypothetical protein BDP81DRAFT_393933 [Colletotrichum phormii]
MSKTSDPLVKITSESFADEESINGLLQRHCKDVPSDAIKSGATWLALAMFRYYRERWHRPMGPVTFEYGNLTLTSYTCCKINHWSKRITKVLDKLVPEANGNAPGATLAISHEDVWQIQRYMVRAWAHNVALSDGEDGTDKYNIFSGGPIAPFSNQGLSLQRYAPLLSFGFVLDGSGCYAWLPTAIPEHLLFETFGEMSCELADLATVYFEEGDEGDWEDWPEDEEDQGDQA